MQYNWLNIKPTDIKGSRINTIGRNSIKYENFDQPISTIKNSNLLKLKPQASIWINKFCFNYKNNCIGICKLTNVYIHCSLIHAHSLKLTRASYHNISSTSAGKTCKVGGSRALAGGSNR